VAEAPYALFFIELHTRRVHLAGCGPNPGATWVTQQARNLVIEVSDRAWPLRFLIPDRDAKLSAGFAEVFGTERIEIIRTPLEAPNADAHPERFVRTLREECLDWLLIVGRSRLARGLREYVDHYNRGASPGARPAGAPALTADHSTHPGTRARSAAATGSADSSMSTHGRRESGRRVCEPCDAARGARGRTKHGPELNSN
jgi:hypothetical protein